MASGGRIAVIIIIFDHTPSTTLQAYRLADLRATMTSLLCFFTANRERRMAITITSLTVNNNAVPADTVGIVRRSAEPLILTGDLGTPFRTIIGRS